VHWAFWRGT